MIKIFKILDLVVSLVLVALGVAIYFITKNWWAVAPVGAAYIVWEIIVFRTYFKASKVNSETWKEGYNIGYENATTIYEEDDEEEENE